MMAPACSGSTGNWAAAGVSAARATMKGAGGGLAVLHF